MARTDDVINVAGHRLSTGAMEEVLASHPDVAECAVIGVADALKGQLPLGFLCLNKGCDARPRGDRRRMRAAGARPHRPGRRLQDRRSSSTACRRRARARSCAASWAGSPTAQDWKVPATIDDPAILDEIGESLAARRATARPGLTPLRDLQLRSRVDLFPKCDCIASRDSGKIHLYASIVAPDISTWHGSC